MKKRPSNPLRMRRPIRRSGPLGTCRLVATAACCAILAFAQSGCESEADRIAAEQREAKRLAEEKLKLEEAERLKELTRQEQIRLEKEKARIEHQEYLEGLRWQQENQLKEQQAMLEAAIREQKERERVRDRIRAEASGRKLGTLETTKGKIYENAVINEVSAVGISIQHASGSSRVPFEDLPAFLQQEFGFDPAEKAKLIELERRLQMTHEQRLSVAAERKASQPHTDTPEITEKRARLNRNLTVYNKQIDQLQNEIRSLEWDLSAELRKSSAHRDNRKTGGISRAPQVREAIARKNQELKEARAKAAAIKAELNAL